MGQLKRKADASAPAKTFKDAMAKEWSRIEAVLPKHMSSERMFQMAVSTYNHDPKLAECGLASFMSCIMKCSALGLEPSSVDGLGRAYILPFRNGKTRRMEATFILGYKGMIDLARRSGEIESISARAVYDGDEFEYEFGLDEKLRHVPTATDRSPAKLTHAYCVAKFENGGHYIDVMTRAELDAVRKRSKSADNGPWVTDYEAMCRKSVVRRAFPYLPVSIESQMASASDETDGGYVPMLVDAGVALPEPEPIDVEPEPAPEPGPAPAVGDAGDEAARRAACKTCGNVVEAAPDAELADLNVFQCCEKPDYRWA